MSVVSHSEVCGAAGESGVERSSSGIVWHLIECLGTSITQRKSNYLNYFVNVQKGQPPGSAILLVLLTLAGRFSRLYQTKQTGLGVTGGEPSAIHLVSE